MAPNLVDNQARKIKVLYLNSAPFIGGAQITLRHIIRLLDRSRFEPYLAIPHTASAAGPAVAGNLDLHGRPLEIE